ncbi:hypothetical protein MycrhDRAFT_1976 [Mycolicibacterium rhodesiae JS60]|nr:hypothetical protein MycrhDRAFT_1976 [Mycolicibacterium rhodesiae JS60]
MSEAPFPTIRAVECAPWCTDEDGHTNATSRHDQNCWGCSHYVEPSLEDVEVNPAEEPGTYRFWPSVIGPCAYQGFNQRPCVYLHFKLASRGNGVLDDSCKLTAAEARQLAEHLVAVAKEIEAVR